MRRGTKLLLGTLTIWPLIAYLLAVLLQQNVSLVDNKHYFTEHRIQGLMYTVSGASFVLVSIAMDIFYVRHVRKNSNSLGFSSRRKLGWIAAIIALGPITTPIYFYNYFWRDPPKGSH